LFEEQKGKKTIAGFTENYIRVETGYRQELENQIIRVKLENLLLNGNVWGKIV
jgi:hypothetical protein